MSRGIPEEPFWLSGGEGWDAKVDSPCFVAHKFTALQLYLLDNTSWSEIFSCDLQTRPSSEVVSRVPLDTQPPDTTLGGLGVRKKAGSRRAVRWDFTHVSFMPWSQVASWELTNRP